MSRKNEFKLIVGVWLWIGVFMVLMQVVIGGVTRLTGSGLSITKWEIVTGTLPPLSTKAWESEFDLYKETPQYEKINEGMSMAEFKFIYFFEYIHRLWARIMGFVFAIPFFIFLRKGYLGRNLVKGLLWVILFAALAASFGWIMVASGLEERPWVNAYKLSIHLSIAVALFGILFWYTVDYWISGREVELRPDIESKLDSDHSKINTVPELSQNQRVFHRSMLRKSIDTILVLVFIQIIVGGIMSGMKAGVYFPTFPKMGQEWLPSIVFKLSSWNVDNFVNYDTFLFAPALVQLVHRFIAFLLVLLILRYVYKIVLNSRYILLRKASYLLTFLLVIQFTLGVITVINCLGTVPVVLGVLHQLGAILLFSAVLYSRYLVVAEQ